LKKVRSLQFNILLFFIISSSVTFLLLGSFVTYEYHQEQKMSLHNSLQVLVEDVIEHEFYKSDPEKIKENFHFLEGYHKAPFLALFDQLEFKLFEQKPLDSIMSITHVLPDGRYLQVSSTCKNVRAKTLALVLKLVSVFGVMLLLFLLVFMFFLSRLLYPLRCLVNFCKRSSKEDLSVPLCRGTSEVNNLRSAIIDLLKTNQMLCKEKQNIFKEAAHEIKSPIAVLKARLALFKQDESFDKKSFVYESEEDIATISNKLKELIFLKEIEWVMQQQKEEVPVQEQCSLMQQAFRPILEKKGLQMISNSEEDFNLYIHKEAMQKVMQAVFENIFMHTKNNTIIYTYVDSKKQQLKIVNEIGSKGDETLFSSHIGSRLIKRLSSKLDYRYETHEDKRHFTTIITFNVQSESESCEL